MKDILTAREKEVVKYIAEGMTNIEIGKILHISKHTVKAEIEIIYRKVGCNNRVVLSLIAYKQGLLDLE